MNLTCKKARNLFSSIYSYDHHNCQSNADLITYHFALFVLIYKKYVIKMERLIDDSLSLISYLVIDHENDNLVKQLNK